MSLQNELRTEAKDWDEHETNGLYQMMLRAANELDRLTTELTAVKAERDALRADAERYRWLRHDDNNGFISPELARGEKLDEEIDAYLTRGLHLPPLYN